MVVRKIWLILILGVVLISCQQQEPEGASLSALSKEKTNKDEKKVIVMVVDSMTETLIHNGLENGATPALSYLIDHGTVYHDLISPFPTMSVVIESSLITGTPPNKHQVPGLIWYDETNDELVDYGSTVPRTWKLGTKPVLMNGLYYLNNQDLSQKTETIYEALHQKGRTTGSVNMLVYRGPYTHEISPPPYLKQWLDLPDPLETKGPDLLALGQVIKPKVIQQEQLSDGLFNRFGINDDYSGKVAETLIKKGEQPDFMMIFFPDFDKEAHKNGPNSTELFASIDLKLQQILNAYESWDKSLEETTFIIIGDHSQDKIKEKGEEAAIELALLLDPYKVAPLLDEPSSGDVVIANNHRMAYVYLLNDTLDYPMIADRFAQDSRIDHVAWLEEDKLILYQVGTSGYLRITEDGKWQDRYGQSWEIEGNEAIADIHLNKETMSIDYNDYPDIFHQLFAALQSHNNPMIITVKPGYILKTEGAPVHHGGGEHGGLHHNDTVTSMIIVGTDKQPEIRRMENLKEYFLSLYQ